MRRRISRIIWWLKDDKRLSSLFSLLVGRLILLFLNRPFFIDDPTNSDQLRCDRKLDKKKCRLIINKWREKKSRKIFFFALFEKNVLIIFLIISFMPQFCWFLFFHFKFRQNILSLSVSVSVSFRPVMMYFFTFF